MLAKRPGFAVDANLARLHVQMHVGVPMEGRVEAVSPGFGPQPRHGGPRRLPHDLPQAPGQGQRAGAGHPARLDEDHLTAARPGPARPDGDARQPGTNRDLPVGMPRRAEHLDDGLRRDFDRRLVPFVLFFVLSAPLCSSSCFFVPVVLIAPFPLGSAAYHLGAHRAECLRQIPTPACRV